MNVEIDTKMIEIIKDKGIVIDMKNEDIDKDLIQIPARLPAVIDVKIGRINKKNKEENVQEAEMISLIHIRMMVL